MPKTVIYILFTLQERKGIAAKQHGNGSSLQNKCFFLGRCGGKGATVRVRWTSLSALIKVKVNETLMKFHVSCAVILDLYHFEAERILLSVQVSSESVVSVGLCLQNPQSNITARVTSLHGLGFLISSYQVKYLSSDSVQYLCFSKISLLF